MGDECGCRATGPIGELMADHERIIDAAVETRRALDAGDLAAADRYLVTLATQLDGHLRSEECGLFATLRDHGTSPVCVDRLAAEHRRLDALLMTALAGVPGWTDAARELVDLLLAHLDAETAELFPVVLAAFDAGDWQRAAAAIRC